MREDDEKREPKLENSVKGARAKAAVAMNERNRRVLDPLKEDFSGQERQWVWRVDSHSPTRPQFVNLLPHLHHPGSDT